MSKAKTRRRAKSKRTNTTETMSPEAVEPIMRSKVPGHEVMDKLFQRRGAYHQMLDEVVKAALGHGEPGRDGQTYEEGRIDDGTREPARRNVRTNAFDLMASKGQLKPHEWAAGARFRDDWELAQIAPLRAGSLSDLYDVRTGPSVARAKPPEGLSKEQRADWLHDQTRRNAQTWKVKASTLQVSWDDLKPHTLDAQDRLKAVARAVGNEGYRLLVAICVEGRTMTELERGRQFGTRKTISRKLREAIGALGQHYGLWMVAKGGRPTLVREFV